jgi:hypothetical protein
VVAYGPFSLCVLHKEALCPSNGGINRLKMMKFLPNRHFLFKKLGVLADILSFHYL